MTSSAERGTFPTMAHAIILAGGLATRLGEISKRIPKCLVPCANRPFIDYSLAWMAQTGVRRATFVLGHLAEQATQHLSRLRIDGLQIDWVLEGEQRLGTGGAVALALREAAVGDDFLIVYGDSFLPIDFGNVVREARALKARSLMTVFHNQNQFDTSNVLFQKPWVKAYTKDTAVQARLKCDFIDYGVSYWQTAAFREHTPQRATWDLAEVLTAMAERGELHGLQVTERFYEVGSPAGYKEFNELTEGKIDLRLHDMIKSALKRVTFEGPV